MPRIEPYAAPNVYDPPMYSQAVKVAGSETILFIAGQVAYGRDGTPMHAGDFKAQARAALHWRAWNRYEELTALKRFRSGRSGSDVLVFRPRLREPRTPLAATQSRRS